MRRFGGQLEEPSLRRSGGEVPLVEGVTIDVPEGWAIVGGTVESPPRLAGITSFVEFADDAVVVTVLTRNYSFGPDTLLREITGEGCRVHRPRAADPDLLLRPEASGCTRSGCDGSEEYFVASLVIERPPTAPAALGVELVAAGPVGAVAERLPVLISLLSSIGYR